MVRRPPAAWPHGWQQTAGGRDWLTYTRIRAQAFAYRYLTGEPLSAIASEAGLTQERVRQIVAKRIRQAYRDLRNVTA